MQVKDPRITIINNRAYMTDLRERDAGTFAVTLTDGMGYDAIKLVVSCENIKLWRKLKGSARNYVSVLNEFTLFFSFITIVRLCQP